MRLPGILTEAEVLDSDDWYTPPYIFDALGLEFDLDPCAPPGGVPWIPAAHHYSEVDDGLLQPWFGRVWLNPPYSDPYPWVERLVAHDDGIALIPADTAGKNFHRWVPTADLICFVKDRVTFLQPDNPNVTSARFPSLLAAWGPHSAQALQNSNLGWCVSGLVTALVIGEPLESR